MLRRNTRDGARRAAPRLLSFLGIVTFLGTLPACGGEAASGKTPGGCSGNDDCESGEVCKAGVCETLCSSSNQCEAGEVCAAEGICAPGTGDPPVILSIDGTASEDPDATHAPHRMNDRLVISGANLTDTSVSITGTNPTTDTYKLAECEPGTDVLKTVALPPELATELDGRAQGEFSLSVMNQAGECAAELWLLRGEVADLTLPVTIGSVTINATGFQVAGRLGVTGNTSVSGNLDVTGAVDIGGVVDAAGITIDGAPLLGSYWSQSNGDLTYDAGHVAVGTHTAGANLTVQGTFTRALTGIVSTTSGSVVVNGSGTVFQSELRVGDAFAVGGETFTVAVVADDTTLELDVAPSAGVSDAAAYTDADLLTVASGDGVSKLHMDKSGRIGLGTTTPAGHLEINRAGGDQINLVETSPQIKFTDTDHEDFWIHANSNRLYFLWDEDDDGGWNSPHPLYLERRKAVFGGDVDVGGNVSVSGSINVALDCQTILSPPTAETSLSMNCPAGYIATGSGWEPGTNWDYRTSHRVTNGTNSTSCSFSIGGLATNWRPSCTCCRVITN